MKLIDKTKSLVVMVKDQKIVTVLVNWRQPKLTLAAVDAVRRQTIDSTIIVVDNGSGDDSFEILQRDLPSDVLVIAAQVNLGFGGGCNVGIERALELGVSYIWLLNNDATPAPNCLEEMLAVAIVDDTLGVVGANIIEPSGLVPDHAGTIMNGLTLGCRYASDPVRLNESEYGWITGACMFLNANAIRTIGLFDTGYFMYWEDADLCSRLKKADFKFGVANRAIVSHAAGSSSGDVILKRFEWHINSQLRWINKHSTNIKWAKFMLWSRHLIKSVCSGNFDRLKMTLRMMLA